MPDYLCFGNFVGAFGSDRDAYIQLESRGNYMVAGTLDIEGPNAVYSVTGTCEQVGDVADVEIRLNGGQPYVGQIYRANDGQVYWEASQPGTGIRFALQRQ